MTPTLLSGDLRCPACGAKNDGALAADGGRPPKAGNVSICVYCAEFNIYDGEPLVIRRPTPQEAAFCTSSPEMIYTQAAIMRMRGLGRSQ